MAAGCTFVAVSRLWSLEDGVFEPISLQRLSSISCGRNIQTTVCRKCRYNLLCLEKLKKEYEEVKS